jgi:hypothetical protein
VNKEIFPKRNNTMRKQRRFLRVLFTGVFIFVLSTPFLSTKENPFNKLRINGKRLEQRILELAEFGKDDRPEKRPEFRTSSHSFWVTF